MSVLEFLVTFNIFALFLLSTPFVLLSYIVVKLFNALWFLTITYLEPDLNFVRRTTLRTLSDTHRNKGIITILLTVNGPANPEAVKRHLQEIVSRVDKQGNPSYPFLKQCLVCRYGTYAWKSIDFNLDQNLVVAPNTFRGRSINDINIQDCVSDIASKYLSSGMSPWQITIIPSTEQQHYIFLKVHHVLLSEGLSIADLLPFQNSPNYDLTSETLHKTPLRNVFRKMAALQELKDRLTQDCTNTWNEFISNYDPMENPDLFKCAPGLSEYFGIQLVTMASIWREYKKGLKGVNRDWTSKFSFLLSTWTRERRKRRIPFSKCLMVTISPLRFTKNTFKFLFHFFKWILFTLPLAIYHEVIAIYTAVVLQYCDYTNTVGLLYYYVPLIYRALKEVFYFLGLIFQGPRNILEEVFASQEIIQTVTLCGRKIVSWSEPVPKDLLVLVTKAAQVSQTEIVLTACSAGISKYFDVIQDSAPKEISITCRNICSDYIFQRSPKSIHHFGGVLCLDLPIGDLKSNSRTTLEESLNDIAQNMLSASNKQQMIYLLSILQTRHVLFSKLFPSTLIGIFLRVLSLKYSICFSEISNKRAVLKQKTTWGKDVASVIYWRPPQANISISLCLNEYGNDVRLAVMCDAQLAPHHPELVKHFKEYVEEMGRSLGVPNVAAAAAAASAAVAANS